MAREVFFFCSAIGGKLLDTFFLVFAFKEDSFLRLGLPKEILVLEKIRI